ncbi:MAG TPA: PQQ-binding-like beta-propeller repeat protein [Ignavibacteriaceae bacterium]|nr:PQQ-binding-like beta-propeller repeat protein [Ignavibacteriaceae bacterium]
METIFYHDNFGNPLTLDIIPVQIKEAGAKESFKDFNFSEEQKNYLTRYINPERNSRMNSGLPQNEVWKIKWSSKIDSSSIPWYILIKDDRLIVQNESGWQLFDTAGNLISSGLRAEGDIVINKSDKSFYLNDPSGYIQNVDLNSGKRKFYVYPYLGKGFKRSVIYTNGNEIIESGYELPVMTHNSTIKPPDMNILEQINIDNPVETDEDGILKPPVQSKNLLVKAGSIITAIHDSTVIIAAPDHIYFLDADLNIIKDLSGNFTPLDMSIDEEMRIYLLAGIDRNEQFISEFWLINSEGNLICKTEIPALDLNNLTPPVIGYNHTAYIAYNEKIVAVAPTGKILWENYIQKPLAGIAVVKDYLFLSEGNLLTAFDSNGERRFFYQFDDELSTSPLLVNNEIFVATRKNLYCIVPR